MPRSVLLEQSKLLSKGDKFISKNPGTILELVDVAGGEGACRNWVLTIDGVTWYAPEEAIQNYISKKSFIRCVT